MFSDNVTKDLAKTAYQIMSKDIQEEEMTNNIMNEINDLDEASKVQLGESLIEAHRNSLTED